jgi:DDE superfamily endonuclease
VVFSLRATFFAFVGGCHKADAPPCERGEKGRSRAEGSLLLRAVSAGDGRDLAEVRGRSAGERHNHTVSWVVLPQAPTHRGKEALLLIWDNASWHKSHEVREWIIAHNREVKASGHGVRIVPCLLPTKSPWLNAIEPQWIHGKRKVVEPERLLGAYELADRVCEVFGCAHEEHLSIPQEVA